MPPLDEYRGVLLLIATVLRSSKGRELLSKNPHFENPDHVKDWLVLHLKGASTPLPRIRTITPFGWDGMVVDLVTSFLR